MTTTLVVPSHIARELWEAASANVESAGVLLAKHVRTPRGHHRLLARQMYWVPADAYLSREATGMAIASHGYVPALTAAADDQSVPMWLHTHPGTDASPEPSERDTYVDEELADLFRLRSGSAIYGAIIIGQTGDNFAFTGYIESSDLHTEIDRLWVTGSRFSLAQYWRHQTVLLPRQFDRNILAFGGDIQRILGELRIAVVGCGGIGSAVIEQLVRLGVRRICVFDPDVLTASNLTRLYGSFPEQVGIPKVDVVASHVRRITPDAEVDTVNSKITQEATAKRLLDADVVFGCTDDNAGRLVLSRLASYTLTPVIDCGVLLSSSFGGQLEGIDGRVTVLAPGTACLVCRNRIDLQRAAAEMLEPEELRRRVDEGYAPALAGIEPAVVAFTTMVAAAAVNELLERLIHYGPEAPPTEVLLRVHEREISTNREEPREGHYCHRGTGKLGLGITEPFLEQTWQ